MHDNDTITQNTIYKLCNYLLSSCTWKHKLEGLLYHFPLFHSQSQTWQAISGHVFSCGNAFAHAGSAVEKALLHKINKKPPASNRLFCLPLATNCTHSMAALNFAHGAGKSFVRASRIFVITMRIMLWSSMHNFSPAKWLNVFLDTSNRTAKYTELCV
jgi:hypothetical protein